MLSDKQKWSHKLVPLLNDEEMGKWLEVEDHSIQPLTGQYISMFQTIHIFAYAFYALFFLWILASIPYMAMGMGM